MKEFLEGKHIQKKGGKYSGTNYSEPLSVAQSLSEDSLNRKVVKGDGAFSRVYCLTQKQLKGIPQIRGPHEDGIL